MIIPKALCIGYNLDSISNDPHLRGQLIYQYFILTSQEQTPSVLSFGGIIIRATSSASTLASKIPRQARSIRPKQPTVFRPIEEFLCFCYCVIIPLEMFCASHLLNQSLVSSRNRAMRLTCHTAVPMRSSADDSLVWAIYLGPLAAAYPVD